MIGSIIHNNFEYYLKGHFDFTNNQPNLPLIGRFYNSAQTVSIYSYNYFKPKLKTVFVILRARFMVIHRATCYNYFTNMLPYLKWMLHVLFKFNFNGLVYFFNRNINKLFVRILQRSQLSCWFRHALLMKRYIYLYSFPPTWTERRKRSYFITTKVHYFLIHLQNVSVYLNPKLYRQ